MATRAAAGTGTRSRTPLSRDRILRAAVDLADSDGLPAVTMRRLGQVLGVEAMSLYNHVASKDDLLDGVADLVAAEYAVPAPGTPWREGLRSSAHSTREVLLRHPWAAALMESRLNAGPARLRYLDAVVGVLREDGFPISLAYHAFRILDSYVYGFVLQEVAWQFDEEQMPEVAAQMLTRPELVQFRYLDEMGRYVRDSGHDPTGDFDYGLELVVDGLGRRLDAGAEGAGG